MKILVLGGSGYIGRAVCDALKKHDVSTFGRHGDYQGSVLRVDQLYDAIKGKDAVVNLVGLTPVREPAFASYQLVHVQGVKAIIEACKKAKVKRLVHVSALGASEDAPTEYLRTKGEAETLLQEAKIGIILRPSFVLGWENELVRQIMKWPFFPNIRACVQPIVRADLAQVIELAVLGKIKVKKLDVAGEEQINLYDLARKIRKHEGKFLMRVPLILVRLGIWFAAKLGLFGMSDDQLRALHIDNTTNDQTVLRYIKPMSIDTWLNESRR